jgi:hypothetical protein
MPVTRADEYELSPDLDAPQLMEVPLQQTFVDPSLQRSLNLRNVNQIARAWNDHKGGAIIVSERAQDGAEPTYHVLDGWTRRNGKAQHVGDAAVREGATIRALVYRGLSREDEAKLFLVFNDERSNVPPTAKFYVALEAGLPREANIDAVLAKRNLAISNPPDASQMRDGREYVISSPGTLLRIAMRYPATYEEALDFAFDAIDAAYPTFDASVRYQGWLIEAMTHLHAWTERYDAIPDPQRLAQYLHKGVTTANIVSHTPDLLKTTVRSLAFASSGNLGQRTRDIMIRIYNAHVRGTGIPEPWKVGDDDEEFDETDDQ